VLALNLSHDAVDKADAKLGEPDQPLSHLLQKRISCFHRQRPGGIPNNVKLCVGQFQHVASLERSGGATYKHFCLSPAACV
jgi:hypothetical protein